MKKFIGTIAIATLFVGMAVAAENGDSFKIIHVQDLADLLSKQPSSTWVYDADPPRVREQEGVIPGARLLSSSSRYDLSDLPGSKDSRVVFYCHNTY